MKIAVLAAVLGAVAAAPDAVITPRAELPSGLNNNIAEKRQNKANSDPAFLGWISTSGQSEFADARSCDYPATFTRSGSLAQCCQPSMSCDFFSTCSGGTVFAATTSVFCDWGYCNTGVVVSATDAKDGASVLGCWATDLGTAPFRLVRDVGSATIAPDSTSRGASSSRASRTSAASTTRDSSSRPSSSDTSATEQTSPTSSTGAAAGTVPEPVAALVGMAAGLFALL